MSGFGRRVGPVLATVLVALVLGGVAPAAAHEMSTGGAVTVVQTLGPREITLTVTPPTTGPGPMPVSVAVQGPPLDAPLSVGAVPADAGQPGGGTGAGAGQPAGGMAAGSAPVPGALELRPAPGTASASGTLRVDRTGPWELVLTSGADVARVPVVVPAEAPTPAWAWAVRAGLVVAVVGAIAALLTRPGRRRVALGLGGIAVVGASVAATAFLLSFGLPAATASSATASPATSNPGTSNPGTSMPGMAGHGSAMPTPATSMPTPVAGALVVTPTITPPAPDGLVPLDLRLTDGSTGAPVDDLAVHDDALLHLAVLGPGGRLFHVHPARVAPGRFTVRLPLTDAGRYGLFAEVVRGDGGHQVSRSAFTVTTPGSAADGREITASGGPAGPREVAGMHVDIAPPAAVAGQDARIALTFGDAQGPVRDLQAWVGMAGHLMILGPTTGSPDPLDPAASFAHVHDMTPPVQYGFGPTVAFTYAFPAAGRYELWAQVQRDWRLVTIPVTVDVAPATTP